MHKSGNGERAINEESAAAVHEDFGVLVHYLTAAPLQGGVRLVEQDAVARDVGGRVHGRDVEVLNGLRAGVGPAGPDEVPVARDQ